MIVLLMKNKSYTVKETHREFKMECNNLLTQPTVFVSPLARSDPSVLKSLMRKSKRTDVKSM